MTDKTGVMVLLVGPSCSGKTTVMQGLLARYPDRFARLKSFTTRQRRAGEGDEEYDFITIDAYHAMQKAGDVAQSTMFGGNYYGTRISDLEILAGSGKVPVCIVEPSGVSQFKNGAKNFRVEVFYISAGKEILLQRWLERVVAENGDPKKFAARILNTLNEEVKWDMNEAVRGSLRRALYDCNDLKDADLFIEVINTETRLTLRSLELPF